MSILVLVLALIVLAASLLAVELLRPEPVSEKGLAGLNQSLVRGQNYEPTKTLFEEPLPADLGLVIRRYLKRLRGDFLTAWAVCRLLGSISQEADVAPGLFRCWLSFHGLYAVVWLKTYAGQSSRSAGQLTRLTAAYGGLRQRATALVQFDAGLVADGSGRRRIRI